MGLIKRFNKIRYINSLKKETSDVKFLKKVVDLTIKIENYKNTQNVFHTEYDKKIEKHYSEIERLFLDSKNNDIKHLETKKTAFNYHLYLLQTYYNKLYEDSFCEKLS